MKKISKVLLCGMLSLAMMVSTVVVGANPKTNFKKSGTTADNITPKTISTVAQWSSFYQSKKGQGGLEGIADDGTGHYAVGYVTTKTVGTLMVRVSALLDGAGANVILADKNNKVVGQGKNHIWIKNVKANQKYTLFVAANNGQTLDVEYLAGIVKSTNNRTITNAGIVTASTGSKNYQQFKMKKKGIVKLTNFRINSNSSEKKATYSLQKKSGKKWSNIATKQGSKDEKVFGLNKGTYRVVTNGYSGEILVQSATLRYYSSSYGTKKSKAKSIARKKAKKNTLLTTDKAGKAHWYKFKVSKTRTTTIRLKGYGSNGNISFAVYGSGNLKRKTSKNGTQVTYTGKLKKGTYYVKIYKAKKSVSGAYEVKYVK